MKKAAGTVKINKADLPSDGERMVPEYHKGHAAYGDHMVRYSAVVPVVKGKVVLDIASGSGYGTKLLATEAKHVYGVDIEADAITYANENYSAKNVEYKIGSGTEIPLEDNSVDVVVSFETIEHIEDSVKFVEELHRVLKPDGLAIISTPNDIEFPEGNHYHVHEYTYDELVGMVSKHFKNVEPYYQATWYYTALTGGDKVFKEWDSQLRVMNVAPLDKEQVLFFMLFCSNRKITETIEPIGATAEHYSARKMQEKEILTQKHISNIEEQLSAAQAFVKKQTDDINMLSEQNKKLTEELETYQASHIAQFAKKLKSRH